MTYFTEVDKIRKRVQPFIGIKAGLDLGCRDVKISEYAIGVDSYRESKAATIIGDVCDLSKIIPKGNIYSWIFSSHLLEHLSKHPKEIVKEWLKFIEPKGFLILYLPDIDYYKKENPEHVWNFTSKQWYEALKEENIIVYEKRNPDVDYPEEYSILIILQKEKNEE